MTESYEVTLRDQVAHKLANAALLIATPWYRNLIRGAIIYGLRSAVRDVEENRPPPLNP
jgi:hypothetical protein